MSELEPRRGILAGGNFIVDTVKVIDEWPRQDTLCSIRSRSRSNGGGPYNILKNLSLLAPDIPREACGLLGNDDEGNWILQDCHNAGIDTCQLRKQNGLATSVTDAMTEAKTGRRTFFHERGANAMLDVKHFDFRQSQAKIFSFGYLMLLDRFDVVAENGATPATTLLRAARSAGLITAVDSVSTFQPQFPEIAKAALVESDIFFVNEIEAGWILGCDVNANNMEFAIRELAALGSPGVVVLHIPESAMAYTWSSDELFSQSAVDFPEERIVGASGAGDAFATGFLYAMHEAWSVEEALKCAVCVAAMSLTDGTPSQGLRGLDECMQLSDQYGFKVFQ